MTKKSLIVQGGWKGHEPKETAEIMAEELRKRGYEVEVADTLDALNDLDKLRQFDVITPHWTMGELGREQARNLLQAVQEGVSLAGIHGGMGDAFRNASEYQFMVGGQFVAHPGGAGITYKVEFTGEKSPITEGLKGFEITTEQYYMHMDPAVRVLAVTYFGQTRMPVVWTKMWGKGHVFYCSLGHNSQVVGLPHVRELVGRGLAWAGDQAARAKASAAG